MNDEAAADLYKAAAAQRLAATIVMPSGAAWMVELSLGMDYFSKG